MSCPCIVMRATKNLPPALQLLKNLLPSDKKPVTLPADNKSIPVTLPLPSTAPPDCLRCGRQDHQTLRCTAKYDVNGYEIGKPI